MQTESLIVPIAPAPENTSIASLLALKARYPPSSLLSLQPGELHALRREYYRQALAANLVALINLVTRQLGALDASTGLITWRATAPGQPAIVSGYAPNLGTTEVRVSDRVVFHNHQAGQELIVPGQWLHVFADAFRRIEAEQTWREEIRTESARESLILTLGADV